MMRSSGVALALVAAWSHQPRLADAQAAKVTITSPRARSKRERSMDATTGGGGGTIDGDLEVYDSIFAERNLTLIVGETR